MISVEGDHLVSAGQAVTITRVAAHSHVAAVHAMAVKLRLLRLFAPACP
jgi:hypothetical protein